MKLPAHREDPSVHYVAGSLVLGVLVAVTLLRSDAAPTPAPVG